MSDTEIQAALLANLERGVYGGEGIFPDWVCVCREALRHTHEHPPIWLPDLLAALGWQSGTIHQALSAVRRLVEASKREAATKKPQ